MNGCRFSGYGTEGNHAGSMKFSEGHDRTFLACRTREGDPVREDGLVVRMWRNILKSFDAQFTVEAVGNPVQLNGTKMRFSLAEYNNASNDDLQLKELAIDHNV
jgi:hypothetical protein